MFSYDDAYATTSSEHAVLMCVHTKGQMCRLHQFAS